MSKEKKVILIIEDELAMLNVLTDTLKAHGFETLQAKNGEEGLALALQKHPDLILLDIYMPKLDGLALMDKLRRDEWGNKVPLIVLTNISPDTDETLKAIIQNEPAFYLMKSDNKLDEIAEKINDVLKISPK